MMFGLEKGTPKETKKTREGFVKKAVSLLRETVLFPSYLIKREKLLACLKNDDLYHFDGLFSSLSKEEKEKLKADKRFQKELKIGIEKQVKRGWDIPQQYLDLASEETLQGGLKVGIGKRVERGWDILQQHLDLASEETIRYLRTREEIQEKLPEIGRTHLTCGFSLASVFTLMSKETKASFLNELTPETKQQFATDLISFFFNENRAVKNTITDILKEKSDEEIEQILFDKTELPMGIKLHTEKGTPYGEFLEDTGGFIAHDQNNTWVANPLPNQKATEVAFEVLERLKEQSGYKGDYGYIQTTFPKRLDNSYASIATVVHMFTKDYFETKEGIEKLITHDSGVRGITIYDAGSVITNLYTVPNDRGEATIPTWGGRTDVLLSDTLNDVRNIRTVMTLLVHASEDHLAFSSLGKQFIEEVKDILKDSAGMDMDAIAKTTLFVGDGVHPKELASFLARIAEMREDLNEKIANYEEGRSYLASLTEEDSDYELAKETMENYYRELLAHPTYALRELIERYRKKMYERGYFHEVRGWTE